MTTALEATREELATLRLRVNRLEQAETILSPTYESTEGRQPRGPKLVQAKKVPRRSVRRGPTRIQLREHIIAHGPLTRGELITAMGGHPTSMNRKLRGLLSDGEIGADGRPGGRLYRSPDAPEVVSASTVESSRINVLQTPPERGVYPMYDAIIDLRGGTTEQLTKRTGLPANLVVEQGRRLMQLGLVRFTGVGKERMWLPTQLEIIRDAA
jgi:hypothetical protein